MQVVKFKGESRADIESQMEAWLSGEDASGGAEGGEAKPKNKGGRPSAAEKAAKVAAAAGAGAATGGTPAGGATTGAPANGDKITEASLAKLRTAIAALHKAKDFNYAKKFFTDLGFPESSAVPESKVGDVVGKLDAETARITGAGAGDGMI